MNLIIPTSFVFIPNIIVSIVGLALIGLAEKRFVTRGTVVINILLLWQVLLQKSLIDQWVVVYLNASVLFLFISLYSFLSWTIPQLEYKKLYPIVHDLNYLFYSSKTTLGVVVSTLFGSGFGGAVIISVILWVLAKNYLSHEYPFNLGR